MNKAWFAVSTVLLLAWYAIGMPKRPPTRMAVNVTPISRPGAPSEIVIHVANQKGREDLRVAACGSHLRLIIQRREEGEWTTFHRAGECRDYPSTFVRVEPGRSLAQRLQLEAGEYRIGAMPLQVYGSRSWPAAPVYSRRFTIAAPTPRT